MLINQLTVKSVLKKDPLFLFSLLYIALLPFFIGKIVASEHANIFGLYINYLHIRITLQLIIATVVIYLYSKNKPKRDIISQTLLVAFLVFVSSAQSYLLGSRFGASGLPYFAVTAFYQTTWLLQLLALIYSLKTLWSRKEESSLIMIGIGLSVFVQAAIVIAQFILKAPLLPNLLAGIGQPTVFTSLSQVGMYDLPRVYGTTPHPNILAAIMTFFAFLLLNTEARGMLKKIVLATIAVIVILTLSKSAILALTGIFIIYSLRKKLPKIGLPFAYFAGIALLFAIVLLLPIIASNYETLSFITTRAQIQSLYVALIKFNPYYLLFGTGFRMSIPALYEDLKSIGVSAIFNSRLLVEPPHNVLLLMCIEFGIPVTILSLAYFKNMLAGLTKNQPTWVYLSIIWMLLSFGGFDHFLLY
jgi:hypothetical protein